MANWIHDIEIKNFKSIRQAKIEDCRRVNVFIGYPNVGKSNILEALSLFEIGNVGDVDFRNFLRFGNYSNLFFNNDTTNSIQVNLDDTERVRMKFENRKRNLYIRSENKRMFFEMEVPLNSFKINSMEHVSKASDDYDSFERLQIRKYIFNPTQELHIFHDRKELVSPFGDNIAGIISLNSTLKTEVVELFKQYGLKYAVDENGDIKIVKEYQDQEVRIFPYIQVADTIRRLIFYKAAIETNRDAVLLFEEPEAHMFPPYISKFTSDVMYDDNENQFFIATHSPVVVNDFMENLKYEELSIYTVGYKKQTGETEIKRLSESELDEIYQYGIDLFFNLERFLESEQQ